MEPAAWGLIGTIVGALASIGTTWLTNSSAESLDRRRSDEERKERASTFQRQTLLELQEALHDALRLVTQGHLEDLKAARGGSEWRRNMLGHELDEDIRLVNRRVAILIERVEDDSLRAKLKELMGEANEVLNASSELESKVAMEATYVAADEVLQGVGTVLRSHY